jgi:hypothetical protein
MIGLGKWAAAAALLALTAPAAAQAERLPTLTKTQAWRAAADCYPDGVGCHAGSRTWVDRGVVSSRWWLQSRARCKRVGRLRVTCYRTLQELYEWPPVTEADHATSSRELWTCTQRIYVTRKNRGRPVVVRQSLEACPPKPGDG